MFEQNIAELEKKNPELAAKIKKHGAAKDIEVFQSESGNFIIAYKGVLLHSNEDPLRETKSVWHKTVTNQLTDKDIQIVYGLGLGYLFKRAYVSANSRILVFEPSLDILRFVFENVALASELADDRVFFVNTQKEVNEFFETKYLPGDKIEVLFLPGYLNLPNSKLLEFSNEIYRLIKERNIDQNTAFLHAKDTVRNFVKRIDLLSDLKPVNCLENTAKGKTALVLAAGPSLKDDIELIKKNKEKFITIAILPILPLLLDNGIEPDFVTVVDPARQLFKIEQYKDKLSNLNLVMESRADIQMNHLKTKTKFLYFPLVDTLSDFVINSMEKTEIKELPAVASVSILAYELAKLMGCPKIVFSGLDLAFVGGKPYAHSYIWQSADNESILTLACSEGAYSVKTTMVKSANGADIKTREDYLLFIREFAKLAEQRPDIELINTSLDGAYIDGMTYAPLSEVVEDIQENKDFNLEETLKSLEKVSLADFKKHAKKALKTSKNEFEEFKTKLEFSIKSLELLLDEIKQGSPNLDKFQKLFNQNIDTLSATRTFLTTNFLLSTYLQADIAEFLSTYVKDNQISLNKVVTNLEIEHKLNKSTLDAIDDILSLLNKK